MWTIYGYMEVSWRTKKAIKRNKESHLHSNKDSGKRFAI